MTVACITAYHTVSNEVKVQGKVQLNIKIEGGFIQFEQWNFGFLFLTQGMKGADVGAFRW